jgi:transcriptional regulator with XRE-family HTH domain
MRKTLRSGEHQRFLELLIQARRKAGLTQQQLARKIGRPQSFVAKYENGERRIDIIEFATIARAMNAEPVALFARFLAGQDSGQGRKGRSRPSK